MKFKYNELPSRNAEVFKNISIILTSLCGSSVSSHAVWNKFYKNENGERSRYFIQILSDLQIDDAAFTNDRIPEKISVSDILKVETDDIPILIPKKRFVGGKFRNYPDPFNWCTALQKMIIKNMKVPCVFKFVYLGKKTYANGTCSECGASAIIIVVQDEPLFTLNVNITQMCMKTVHKKKIYVRDQERDKLSAQMEECSAYSLYANLKLDAAKNFQSKYYYFSTIVT
jgi:hypothetical protein